MVCFQQHNRLFLLVIFCLTFSFGACSSGGKSKSADKTPAPFTISAPTGVDITQVAPGTLIESGPISITGIDAATNVSISGGEYAVDNETSFGTSPRTVKPTTIRVRVRSSTKAGQSATAVLNVGGVTASFTVTTEADTTPPEVAILFPPPASMTEGQTLFLRGTVKDVHGTLSEGAVTVNGVEAELELNATADEGTWSVTVDLALGDNTLTVTAEDASGNSNAEESVSSRRVAAIAGESFPDNQNPFFSAFKADIGMLNEKLTAFVTDDSIDRPGVVAVDLATGARTVVADNQGVEESLQFEEPQAVHVGSNEKLYVSDYSSSILEIDVVSSSRRKIAEAGGSSYSNRPLGMHLDGNQLYVADDQRIFIANIDTLQQHVFSGVVEEIPDSQSPFGDLWGMAFLGSKIYVTDYDDQIFSVDRSTGARQLLSKLGIVNAAIVDVLKHPGSDELIYLEGGATDIGIYKLNVVTGISSLLYGSATADDLNVPQEVWGIATHEDVGYVLAIDRAQRAVIAIDLETGKRLVISKSVSIE